MVRQGRDRKGETRQGLKRHGRPGWARPDAAWKGKDGKAAKAGLVKG